MARAAKFDWDDGNTGHIARHDVTRGGRAGVRQPPAGVLAAQKRRGEERVLSAGRTDAGRALQFVYTVRRGKIRVLTAHTAKRKVRERL